MIYKRPRYADVYNGAFIAKTRRGDLACFVSRSIASFYRAPRAMIDVPRHIHKMMRTQRIADETLASTRDVVHWALMVAEFVRRRAACTITRRALEHIYSPRGPWLRRKLALHGASALSGAP